MTIMRKIIMKNQVINTMLKKTPGTNKETIKYLLFHFLQSYSFKKKPKKDPYVEKTEKEKEKEKKVQFF